MNYQLVYSSIIEKAKQRALVEEYAENHHINPKSLGGSDEKSNLVLLTAREHFVVHCLLARIHGGKMWHALIRMKGLKNRYLNSRLYSFAKKKHAIEISKNMLGKNNPMKSEVTKRTHQEKVLLAMNRPEVKEKQSLNRIGMKFSDSHRKALSDSHKGYTFSKEACLNFSKAAKLRMQDPDERLKRSIKLKEIMQDSSHRARISQAMKAHWERKRNATLA